MRPLGSCRPYIMLFHHHAQGRSSAFFASNVSMLFAFSMVGPISSRPFNRQWRLRIVEIERDRAAIEAMNLLGFEIDGQRRICAARSVVHQLVQIFLGDLDRQDAVLGSNYCRKYRQMRSRSRSGCRSRAEPMAHVRAKSRNRNCRRRANLRLAVAGLVQHEIRVFRPVFIEAHFRRKGPCQARCA